MTDEWATPTPRQVAAIQSHAQDLSNILTGRGRHAAHTRQQIGRCVYCSCGQRAQGKMTTKEIPHG
jgi:hypothetical protein